MDKGLQQARHKIIDCEYFRRLWGLHRRVWKPWRWLTIIHLVAESVEDDLWDWSVCWTKLRIVSASGERGVCNLMDIREALTSIEYIWLRLRSGGTNHSAGAGAAVEEIKNWPGTRSCWLYLVQGRRLLGKFGRGWCWFMIFWQDWCQLRTSMPWPRSREGNNLVAT